MKDKVHADISSLPARDMEGTNKDRQEGVRQSSRTTPVYNLYLNYQPENMTGKVDLGGFDPRA